jgi:hypothetical protein
MKWRADVNTTGQWDAMFWVNRVPSNNSTGYAAVYFSMLNNGSTQTLNVYDKPNNNQRTLATYTGLDTGFLVTKFAFNSTDQLTVTINTTTYTTLTFATTTTQNPDRYATVLGGKIQLDYFGVNNSSLALPITLVSFNAKLLQDKVQLNWATANEFNNDFFTIEKSKDGKSWEEIGNINGAGTKNQLTNYTFYHSSPEFGVTYYRLKQTDFDGRYSYSDIVAVEFKSDKEEPCFEERKIAGYCDGYKKEIVIRDLNGVKGWKDEPQETRNISMNETLRHEIVHAFFDECGLKESSLQCEGGWARNEELVDWIAIQAPKMLKAFQSACCM